MSTIRKAPWLSVATAGRYVWSRARRVTAHNQVVHDHLTSRGVPAQGMIISSVLATALVARCAELGLLVLSCGTAHQVIRWIPPLDATAAEISEGTEIFGEALRTV